MIIEKYYECLAQACKTNHEGEEWMGWGVLTAKFFHMPNWTTELGKASKFKSQCSYFLCTYLKNVIKKWMRSMGSSCKKEICKKMLKTEPIYTCTCTIY